MACAALGIAATMVRQSFLDFPPQNQHFDRIYFSEHFQQQYFFLGDCTYFSKWGKLHFLLHPTPFSWTVFLCLRLITTWLFPILGWGNPKMLLLLTETIVLHLMWFDSLEDFTEPVFLRKQKELNESLTYSPWGWGRKGVYNCTVCIPTLSSGDWREMSTRQSPGAQTIKTVRLSNREWSRAEVKLGARDQGQRHN